MFNLHTLGVLQPFIAGEMYLKPLFFSNLLAHYRCLALYLNKFKNDGDNILRGAWEETKKWKIMWKKALT